jgi:HIRAN domain
VILLSCDGDYPLEVRGESFREDAIRRLVDLSGAEQFAEDRCRCELELWLGREPTNPVDPNAVQVLSCSGELLGYVPRELAPATPAFCGLWRRAHSFTAGLAPTAG